MNKNWFRLNSTVPCGVEQIADWHPHLFLEPHIVACVAVLSQYSGSPAGIEVVCTDIVSTWLGQGVQFTLEVSWSKEMANNAERLRLTMQSKQLIELAAVALALILTPHVVDLGQLDVTSYGDRADYRSLDALSVLEISGTENRSELARRQREKVKQALDNPFGLDAYVAICGFSENGHRILFSHHRSARSMEKKSR